MRSEALKDQGVQDQFQASRDEANIMRAAQQAQAPPVIQTVRGPAVLSLFSAGLEKIPQVQMFSLPDVESFHGKWMQREVEAAGLTGLKVPYGVSAAQWLAAENAKPHVAQQFGKFMAEFLASDEYSSELGKAQSSLKGFEDFAAALRSMVVGTDVLELTPKDIEKQVSSLKQRGHMHMCTCGRACMFQVVVCFTTHSSLFACM